MNKMVVFLGERIPLGFISHLHLRGTVIASSLLRAVLGRARRGLGRAGVVISITQLSGINRFHGVSSAPGKEISLSQS